MKELIVGLGLITLAFVEICFVGAALERWFYGKWKIDSSVFRASLLAQILFLLLGVGAWALGKLVISLSAGRTR